MLKNLFSNIFKKKSTSVMEEELTACMEVILHLGKEISNLRERLLAVEKLAVTTANLGDEVSTNLTIIHHFLVEKEIIPTLDKPTLN